MTERGTFDIMDFIALWSLDIGLQNLKLNEIQVDGLMREMTEKQDALLRLIVKQNEEIISLLKELKNDTNRNTKRNT